MTAIILSGGKASRMDGQDKAFLKIDNEPIISTQLRALKKLFKKIIIVTNSPRKYRNLRDIEIIPDIIPHLGPLGGIYSGLKASSSFYNFVVACDMPYIDIGFIAYMYKKSYFYDAVVPKINKRYEPLYCFYSKNCLEFIKQLLDKKMFKIKELFSRIKVKEIIGEEIRQFALGAKIFTNINTKEDLKKLYADRQI